MKFFSKYNSPIGELTLSSDGEKLTGLWISGQAYFPELKNSSENGDLPIFSQTREWLRRFFNGENPGETPPIAPEGTEFRKLIWSELLKIPYGELVSYGDIAKQISIKQKGKFISPRAIGGAVGHNPISIIIPCHRVIGSDGNLTGYAGGLDKKVKLLELEGIDVSEI